MAGASANTNAGQAGGADPAQPVAGKGGTPPAAPADQREKFRGVSFAVEFVTGRNNNFACPMTKDHIRGRWDSSNLRNRVVDDRLADMPVLPGQVVTFDGGSLRVTMRDPLNDPAQKEVLARARRAHRDCFGAEPAPFDDKVFDSEPVNRLKQWCYWARRWLDLGWVEVRSGRVPSMADVAALPGEIEINRYDSSAKRKKFVTPEDEIPDYAPPPKSARG